MTRMQLILSAENLVSVEKKYGFRAGYSDPYAVVTICGGPSEGDEIGRTETIKDCLNPEWVKILYVDVNSEVYMPIKVEIYDKNESDDTLMAVAEFELTAVYQSDSNCDSRELKEGGRMYATVTESLKGTDTGTFTLQLRGLDIENIELGVLQLGKSDPFYEIHRKVDPSSSEIRWVPVYRSEVIENNLNPFWDPLTISLEELCCGDLESRLKIQVLDRQKNGKHRVIGEFETDVDELKNRKTIRGNADKAVAFHLVLEGDDRNRGLVIVTEAELND